LVIGVYIKLGSSKLPIKTLWGGLLKVVKNSREIVFFNIESYERKIL